MLKLYEEKMAMTATEIETLDEAHKRTSYKDTGFSKESTHIRQGNSISECGNKVWFQCLLSKK